VQSRVFHALVQRLVGHDFRDMSCGLRGFTAEAARRLELYGDQHRFIPVIATRLGYRVLEIPGAQHPDNRALRLRSPGLYAGRLLDVLNIYFLTQFTRRPLRFFGAIGAAALAVGFGVSAWLAAERVFGLVSLADRPLLLLGVLLIVVGFQILSIGLLAEIIIFLSAKREIPQARELDPVEAQRDATVSSAAGAAPRLRHEAKNTPPTSV
jgi:dolichol-phosphate mannosyltransferase